MTPYQHAALKMLGDRYDVQVDFVCGALLMKDTATGEILRETKSAGSGDSISAALERIGFPRERARQAVGA